MKLRKLFAWMMTLIMLTGMVPAAQAQVIWCPDLGLPHSWGPSEYWNGTCKWGMHYCTVCGAGDEVPPQHNWTTQITLQPGCDSIGYKEIICADCNSEQGNPEEIPALGHDWGSWGWAHGSAPSCTEGAWRVRSCQRCGRQEDEWVEGGNHRWGEWIVYQDPTCVERGYDYRLCSRCSEKEWRRTPLVDHVFGEWYVMNPPAVGVPGLEVRNCTVCDFPEEREIPALEEAQMPELYLNFGLSSGPENNKYFVPGETVEFEVQYSNPSLQDLVMGHVLAHVKDVPSAGASGLATITVLSAEDVPAGEFEFVYISYTVTEEDAARGAIYGYATFAANMPDGTPVKEAVTDFITAPCGPGELPDDYVPSVDPDIDGDGIPNEEDPDIDGDGIPNEDDPDADGDGIPNEKDPDYKPAAGLTVDMTYTNTPANGSFFTPGEVINYLITVTNTGNVPLTNLQVGNSSSEAVVPAPSEIAPGQTIQVPYYKLVYEGDAKAGGISSYGHANAFNGDPALPESLVSGRSADVFVPCGMGDGTPSVYYLKIVANAPANGLYFTEGETIKYRLSFGNNTKKDIYNITLNDPMANTRSVAFARRLKAGEFLMGEFEHVVTAADVAAGQIVNTATSTWATKAEGALNTTLSNTIVTPCGSNVPAFDGVQAMLEKYIKNEPANGKYFVPGETIEYAVIFMNVCPHELHDVEVIDPLKGGNEDATITLQPVVEPNGTLYLSFNYVVTEADAQRGYVTNTATASWFNPEIEEQGSCDSNTVRTETGYGESTDMGLSGAMTFTKEVTRAPQNGLYFTPGEYIRYTFTLTNTGNVPLVDIGFVDAMLGTTAWDPLAVGETSTWDCYYEVTDLDAAAGSVENIAYVNAFDADENQYVEYSNNVTALCGFPEGENPFGVLTGLEVTKEVESLPLNGSYYTEGETVAYKIIYTNIGEMPLTDVQIYDAMGGMNEIATAEMLNPGESRMCWFNYTVTAVDVTRGYISNTAVGQFNLNGLVNTASSNTVTVDTNGKQDLWTVHTFWPGEDPEYDPSIGWFPDGDSTPEEDTPSFGTVDTDALRGGDTYCVRTITGRDNVSVSYETSFCAEHADTQSSVLMMNQAGTTPEMQMQAAAYAVALWRSEVEKLYQEICDASDPTAKAVAMTEYVRFLSEVANYEAMLKVLYPDQPALVAAKVASMWENKCIDLCYDAHATAAERKDSLLAVTPATGAVAADCTCEVTAQEAGKKTSVQRYCAVHSFPFSMIDALLQGNDSADAWTMVRQIWGVELTNAYNKIYTALGENKLPAMAEYNALTQWMMAREASLIALYPDNPEIVVQIMVKTIMERVNDLCQVIK